MHKTSIPLLGAIICLAAHGDADAGHLTGLPSKPEGEHIAKIKALGDNSWLNLGQAAADPQWGVARGRSWCPKMAYAPDLGGAFFCGTGVHGATPNGRYMDDLWFYDANAHRWICLYPGADPKTLKLKLDEHGFEVNEQGEFVPVSYLSHAYNNTTYNTDTRKYTIIFTHCAWWMKALPQRLEWTGCDPRNAWSMGKIGLHVKHPIFWNVTAGKWECAFVEGDGPGDVGGKKNNYMGGRFEGVVEYLPKLKKTLYTYKGTAWFYDHAANSWTAGPKVPASVSGYDANGCYDARRERVYLARGAFAYLDLQTQKCMEIKAEGQPKDLLSSNGAQLYFDVASGVVLWHQHHGPISIYDPDANKWTDLGNTTPEISWKRFNAKYMRTHGFYNAELNVHYFYLAGDSGHTDATMLAYRYKNVRK